jgi:hypothetical protein
MTTVFILVKKNFCLFCTFIYTMIDKLISSFGLLSWDFCLIRHKIKTSFVVLKFTIICGTPLIISVISYFIQLINKHTVRFFFN